MPNDDSNGAFYTLIKTVCFYLKVPHEQSKFGSWPQFFKRWMALSNLSSGQRYPFFEQLGPGSLLHSRFQSLHAILLLWGGALRDDTKNGCVADQGHGDLLLPSGSNSQISRKQTATANHITIYSNG